MQQRTCSNCHKPFNDDNLAMICDPCKRFLHQNFLVEAQKESIEHYEMDKIRHSKRGKIYESE